MPTSPGPFLDIGASSPDGGFMHNISLTGPLWVFQGGHCYPCFNIRKVRSLSAKYTSWGHTAGMETCVPWSPLLCASWVLPLVAPVGQVQGTETEQVLKSTSLLACPKAALCCQTPASQDQEERALVADTVMCLLWAVFVMENPTWRFTDKGRRESWIWEALLLLRSEFVVLSNGKNALLWQWIQRYLGIHQPVVNI